MSLLGPNLEAFLAIVKRETVHGAASDIGITQTGVTQRIRALEEALSTTLFIRSRRGMRPTPEGESLLRYCQAARDLEGIVLSQIQGSATQTEARLTITGPTSLISSRITSQCMPVLQEFQNLTLNFVVNDLETRVEDLRTGSVQFAIVSPEQVAREMDSKLLKPEKYILVGTPRWKGAGLKSILKKERIIDFDRTDTTTFTYLKKFSLHELVEKSRHFVNNNEALIQMVKAGAGYATLSVEIAKPLIDSGAVISLNEGKSLDIPHALAWYPRAHMPAYFQAILRAIR